MSEKPKIVPDPRMIRSFILYEAVLKTEVFTGYKNFCKVNGDDVMNFVDYNYWYYRFYHGNLDIDHDRSSDPKKPTFDELPVEIVAEIMSKLDVKNRSTSRRVCRKMAAAHGQTSKKFKKVGVKQEIYAIELKLDEQNAIYERSSDRCTVKRSESGQEKTINGNYLTKAMDDLKLMLEGPRIEIKTLSVSIGKHRGWEEMLGMLQKIGGESNSGVLRVEKAQMTVKNFESGLLLLARMKPLILKRIELQLWDKAEATNISEMQIMEQFKKAKQIDIRQFAVIDACLIFNHFKHFEVFGICVHSITVEQIQRLCDMFLFSSSANFKNCEIEVRESLESKYDEIRDVLMEIGQDESRGPGDFNILRMIPHSNEAYMEFVVRSSSITVTRHAKKPTPQQCHDQAMRRLQERMRAQEMRRVQERVRVPVMMRAREGRRRSVERIENPEQERVRVPVMMRAHQGRRRSVSVERLENPEQERVRAQEMRRALDRRRARGEARRAQDRQRRGERLGNL